MNAALDLYAALSAACMVVAAFAAGFVLGSCAGRRAARDRIAALRSQVADLETALDLAPALADLDARARRAEGAAPLHQASEPAR